MRSQKVYFAVQISPPTENRAQRPRNGLKRAKNTASDEDTI